MAVLLTILPQVVSINFEVEDVVKYDETKNILYVTTIVSKKVTDKIGDTSISNTIQSDKMIEIPALITDDVMISVLQQFKNRKEGLKTEVIVFNSTVESNTDSRLKIAPMDAVTI
jgi:hypothetical protein